MARRAECADGVLELGLFHQHIVGVEGRQDEHTHLGGGQASGERGEDAHRFEGQRALHDQGPPNALGANAIGNVWAIRAEDAELFGGSGHRDQGAIGHPPRDRILGIEATEREALAVSGEEQGTCRRWV